MVKGSKHSDESKVKISATKKGQTFTEEHSMAISNALRGKKKTQAHRDAIARGIKEAHARKVLVVKDVVTEVVPDLSVTTN